MPKTNQPIKPKVELVSIASMNAGLKNEIVKRSVDEYLKAVANALKKGNRVELPGIGMLRIEATVPTRIANSYSGPVDVPGCAKLKFNPNHKIKDEIAKLPWHKYINTRQKRLLEKRKNKDG